MRKAIFWDFDGTLTLSYPMWTQAVTEAAAPFAREYGLTFQKLRPFMARGFPWHPDGNPAVTGEAWWEDRVEKFTAMYEGFGVPKPLAEQAARSVREKVLDPRRYQVYPDAAATLALCAYKGYRNYLLSDNFPELPELLEKLYLRQFFPGMPGLRPGGLLQTGCAAVPPGGARGPLPPQDLDGGGQPPGGRGRSQGRRVAGHPGPRPQPRGGRLLRDPFGSLAPGVTAGPKK